MDRAAGLFKTFRKNKFRGPRPTVGEAARLWASEALEQLEQRVLMSANPTPAQSSVLGVSQAIFIKNQGQWSNPSVKFAYQTSAANILMTDRGPIFQVFHPEGNGTVKTDQFVVSFDDANSSAPQGIDRSSAKFNFMVGDKSNWRSGVVGYNKIAYKSIYDGVDLYTWGLRNNLKYEFHVAPGADYSQVHVSLDGIKGLSIDEAGNLHIKTASGEVIDDAPLVYQMVNGKRVVIKAQFKVLDNNTYTFQLNGSYDHSRELILDPTISWTAYLGGTAAEVANGIALDADNNIYVTGSTTSTDFPTFGIAGPGGTVTSPSLGDNTDVFVAKFDPFGVMQWGTYIGGAGGADVGQELVPFGTHLYVVGTTASDDFPAIGVLDTDFTYSTRNGGNDAFLVSLATDGGLNQLEWSAFIGGASADSASSVDVDSAGNVYLAGQTASTAFPTIIPFQATRSGNSDGFIMKFDPVARTPIWSSYFGGNNVDSINDITLSNANDIYVVGTSQSTSGLATIGSYNDTNNGNTDAFVAQLHGANGGPGVEWASYIGGSAAELGNGIAFNEHDATNPIWITGSTAANSTDFYSPVGGRLGNTDAFVACFMLDGTDVTSLQFFDTTTADVGNSISVDPSGNVVMVGNTSGMAGNNYIGFTTVNALSPVGFSPNGGTNDGFIVLLNSGSYDTGILSYFGSSGTDQLNAVVADQSGGLVMVGTTTSSDLPLGTPIAGVVTTYNGNDAFIMRVDPTTAAALPIAPSNLDATAVSMSEIRLTWVGSPTPGVTYEIRRAFNQAGLLLNASIIFSGLPSGTRTKNDTGLDPSTTYFYKVLAVKGGTKVGTRPDSATTQTAEMTPPSGLTATVISAKRIDLKWKDNSSNDTGFEVWRQDLTLGNFDRIATVGAAVTTYHDQDPTLAPNTAYSYQIRAKNDFTESNFSDPAFAVTPSANFIATPTGLVVSTLTNPDGNLLTWQDNSDNEDHFNIERSTAGSSSFTVIGATASLSNAHTFVDTTVVAGQFYNYRVQGVNGGDISAYSNVATSDLAHALAAPTLFDAVAMSNSSIQLVWVNNAVIQTGFIIERAVNKPSDWVKIKTTGANATNLDTKLITNRRYYYRIRATNGSDNSAYANIVTAVTFPVPTLTAPAAPSKLKATALGPNSIRLNWSDNSIDETNFRVERSASPTGPFSIAGTVGVNVKTFTDTQKIRAGTTYYYRVRSWNGQFKSLASNVAQVTTAAPAVHHKSAASISATPSLASTSVFSTKQVTGSDLMLAFNLL